MLRTSVRLGLVVGLLLGSATCGPPADIAVPRQEVNDRLRAACPDESDVDIEAIIILVETDVDRGYTKQRVLDLMVADCIARDFADDATTDACITCVTIVVDEIFNPQDSE